MTVERPVKEAEVFINGIRLTNAQSAALRCALESFASDLSDEGLGDDPMGKAISRAYLERLDEIRRIILRSGV